MTSEVSDSEIHLFGFLLSKADRWNCKGGGIILNAKSILTIRPVGSVTHESVTCETVQDTGLVVVYVNDFILSKFKPSGTEVPRKLYIWFKGINRRSMESLLVITKSNNSTIYTLNSPKEVEARTSLGRLGYSKFTNTKVLEYSYQIWHRK